MFDEGIIIREGVSAYTGGSPSSKLWTGCKGRECVGCGVRGVSVVTSLEEEEEEEEEEGVCLFLALELLEQEEREEEGEDVLTDRPFFALRFFVVLLVGMMLCFFLYCN